jgi:ligand-binding SRPBCC domain-containing protein
MIRFHTLRREQWVPRPVEEIFAFFSDTHNLQELTPPWLRFRILTPAGERIREGSEIRYTLRVHGMPVFWMTEIRSWNPPYRFTDVQRKGPYRLWHHTHHFETKGGGTGMRDVVRYRLPLGALGLIAHRLFVKTDVEKIFDYRYAMIEAQFGRCQP